MRAVVLPLAIALAIILPAPRGRADDTIEVKLFANSEEGGQDQVQGTVAVKSFTVKGTHGTMEIAAANLAGIRTSSRFIQEGHVLQVDTTDGQMFAGVIVSPKTLEIASKYGRFSTSWDDVQDLKVEGRPDPNISINTWDSWNVRIDATSGERMTGVLYSQRPGPIDSVEIDCQLGSLSLKAEKVRSLRFEPEAGKASDDGDTKKTGSIVTTDGVELTGTITIPAGWVMETELGDMEIKVDKLKSITFEGVAKSDQALTPRPADLRLPCPGSPQPQPFPGSPPMSRPEQSP